MLLRRSRDGNVVQFRQRFRRQYQLRGGQVLAEVRDRCSNHASATCIGVALNRFATADKVDDCKGVNPPNGKNGNIAFGCCGQCRLRFSIDYRTQALASLQHKLLGLPANPCVSKSKPVMPKPSYREDLLKAGFELVILRGNCGASVRDIVRTAGVTLGSFSNHFPSKEEFYLELLERYYALVTRNINRTLRNDEAKPLDRLEDWLDIQINFLKSTKLRSGCLIGNLSADAVEHSEAIRKRLSQIYKEIQNSLAYCLEAAVKAGELQSSINCDELAQFLYAAIQGVILQSKVERNPAPLRHFKKTFLAVLRQLALTPS